MQRFPEHAPTSVIVRVLLERLLNTERLDRWFESTCEKQYTRKILFSSLVEMVLQIVCRAGQHAYDWHQGSNLEQKHHSNNHQLSTINQGSTNYNTFESSSFVWCQEIHHHGWLMRREKMPD
ncbi:hypothetical protein ACU6TU_11230 [Halomonas sp. LS-001]